MSLLNPEYLKVACNMVEALYDKRNELMYKET